MQEKRAYEKVVEYIKNEIQNSKLESGDKLPSERNLSHILNLSRVSVREGLRELEQLGFTKTIKNRGSFVESKNNKGFIQAATQNIIDKKEFIYDMLDYRRAIEVEAARLAARRATTDHLLEMKNALDIMNSNENGSNKGIDADLKFHTAIIKASQNKIFIELIDVLHTYMKDTITQTRKYRLTDEEAYEKTIQEHKNIYIAVAKGDSLSAAKLVEHHIVQIKEEIIEFELKDIK